MVIVSAGGEPEETMSTAPERSRNSKLNHFSSLPCFTVKWGRQKQLRCVKDSSSAVAGDHELPTSSSDFAVIGAMKEKLMLEYRTDLHQMKATILSVGGGAPRPWNLRSRRSVCKDPSIDDNGASERKLKSPMRSGEIGSDGGGCGSRAKFSGSLSRREIEEDFLAILGTRPARRPKKRTRYVQKQIDCLCPGFWLSEITADMYKVNECAESNKR